MQQILRVWSGLDLRKRLAVGVATLAMFAAVFGLSRMAANPNMTLLYAGLESGAAGDVVQALEQRGAAYEIRGGSIYVEASERDAFRMTLASEGLPANGTSGYELLDSLSGFGTTSQMFDAAYWRAKEGELARTIVASPDVQQARVHIANITSSPFQQDTRPTASVTVLTSNGGLTPERARALRFLIASAVAGLKPEDVAVIDGANGLVGSPENTAAVGPNDQSRDLKDRVQRLLEARVGLGNAIVELSVERVTESESILERRFDPDGRVLVSSEIEENVNNSTNGASGDVTVASNIPDGDAAGQSDSSSQNSLTRERVDYQVSETQREVVRSAGAIRRITVAVLVNGVRDPANPADTAVNPRSDEELEALRDLVSSAVGFDHSRGDVITIKSMSFEPVLPLGTAVQASFFDFSRLDLMSIFQMLFLGAVSLVLGLFVLRPILAASTEIQQMSPSLPSLVGPNSNDVDTALSGEISSPQSGASAVDPSSLPVPATNIGDADPVERLRALINDRKDETVEILRGWLDDREEQKK